MTTCSRVTNKPEPTSFVPISVAWRVSTLSSQTTLCSSSWRSQSQFSQDAFEFAGIMLPVDHMHRPLQKADKKMLRLYTHFCSPNSLSTLVPIHLSNMLLYCVLVRRVLPQLGVLRPCAGTSHYPAGTRWHSAGNAPGSRHRPPSL